MSKPVIAIFGTNGQLGKPTIEALTSKAFSSKVAFPIRAITRDPSKYQDSEFVKYYKANSADVDSFKDALSGADVLINVGTVNADFDNIIEAAVKYGNLKLYIPSQFGTELDRAQTYLPGFLSIKTNHTAKARTAGLKTVDVITSLFANPGGFLYEIVQHVGIDPATNTATIRGDRDTTIDITFESDIGKALAAIATTPDYSALPDKIRISSDKVKYEQIYKVYEKNHNVTLKREYISKEEALKQVQAKYAEGFDFKDFLFYLNSIASQGVDKGISFSATEDELINPGESLFKWTKYA